MFQPPQKTAPAPQEQTRLPKLALERYPVDEFLRAASLDPKAKPPSALEGKVYAIPMKEGYMDDPLLPPSGNEVRARLDSSNYRNGIYRDITTTIHEEYHLLNSTVAASQNEIIFPIFNKVHKEAVDALIDKHLKSGNLKSGAALSLTQAEMSLLPMSPFTIYVPRMGVAVSVWESNAAPRQSAFTYLSGDLRTIATELYLLKNNPTSSSPRQLFDEVGAHLINAYSALELVQNRTSSLDSREGKIEVLRKLSHKPSEVIIPDNQSTEGIWTLEISDTIEVATALLAYSLEMQKKDPANFEKSGCRELAAYLIKESFETYREGMKIPIFQKPALTDYKENRTYPSSEQFYRALVEGPEGEALRKFARSPQGFGEKWYSEVFVDPKVVFSSE